MSRRFGTTSGDACSPRLLDALHRRAQAKIEEIEARIADLQQIRENLQAVLAAKCDSLTNCSCGMATGLPLDSPRRGFGRVN
jgi:hypothetical protein